MSPVLDSFILSPKKSEGGPVDYSALRAREVAYFIQDAFA
jgi:hypothetical protein